MFLKEFVRLEYYAVRGKPYQRNREDPLVQKLQALVTAAIVIKRMSSPDLSCLFKVF
jgi:hypothetical protein